MIRPVLFVDLPGIIYAIDRRTRSRQHDFANFVCWLEPVESRVLLPPILRNIFPVNPVSRTWICEDHWRLLGFAQVRERPSRVTWDLAYLASMANRDVPGDEILSALLEYTLGAASTHGILRIFAKVEDELPEMELFQKAGFQRYARLLTYVFDPDKASLAESVSLPSLHRWHRHHAWGLHQLYRAVTPQRVQMAEMLDNSEECAKLHVGSLRPVPSLLARGDESFVCDVGVRLGGWLRICRGHGSAPHQLSLIVHPEHADLAGPLLQFGASRLLGGSVRPIYCQVREYESSTIAALRSNGFEHVLTRALLVRHIALLAMTPRGVPALEQRIAYGVKGLGTVNSHTTTRSDTLHHSGVERGNGRGLVLRSGKPELSGFERPR
jgi:N-acetylglutamate synthase-like GNAT family acetyltransferase